MNYLGRLFIIWQIIIKFNFKRDGTYNILNHNCNIFSAHLIKFLLNKSIPKYITYLPDGILNT
jgi:hypothetical protein